MTETTSDREIITTRILKASREEVFQLWILPEHIKHWWGPKGFTNTIHKMDVRPNGEWDFTMHGPDGTDYHNKSIFEEIVAPERIVFRHIKPMHRFKVTATFDALGDQMRLTFRMVFETAEECERVRLFAVDANEENFDRLEDYLKKVNV